MAQGNKKLSKPLAKQSGRRTNAGITKKGHKTIAPKKAILVKANNLKKKVTAQLTAATERSLAERAGHLEVLKGGKRDRKGKEQKKAGV
ncbi:hypothetical protein C7212DRAFT_289929 [Tuber magnatum]|uniref:Uncharacterized protein n=1 Tax=Tuber magnatum TaxID=42249 RepID=A0A317T2E4_9PEZI|nr:hypothetical protein C7212DRAFT_289929 [Tuber magnatum]